MNKKQETNEFVKECITTALLQMLEKQALSDISVTALTVKAGVGRVSFYRNFESKEDVIRQYLGKRIKEWGEEFEKNGSPDTLIESLFSHYYKYRELFILLYHRGLAHISLQNVLDVCGPTADQDNMTAYTRAWFCHGLYGWIEEWFKRGMPETPAEMAELWKQAQSHINGNP
ncbi:MAG: TetR/AcrR family transcriptional regulator [Eubacteriales bacterium]